jgi:ATP-dependent RNA helicase DeaD
MEAPTSAIVFCRTRTEVDELTETLNGRGYRAEALHGGMSQEQRDRVMKRFRGGAAELLIATDVAARGLDIEHLSHVVNYDVPSAPEAYVHRIGRTGRAGARGWRSRSPSRASTGSSATSSSSSSRRSSW